MSALTRVAIGALALACAAALSLWVGTPSGWNPFEAAAALFTDDVSARTLARARGLEILLLAIGGAVQCAATGLVRNGPAGGEAGGSFGASAAGVAAGLGLALPTQAVAGAVGGLLGHLGARMPGAARRVALVIAAPALWLAWSLSTTSGEARVWTEFAHRMLGDVAGGNAGRLAVAGAALAAVVAAALMREVRVRAVLAAAAHGIAAAAVGWFAGLGFLAARFAPAGNATSALFAGAVAVVLGECLLAAASQPGRLPVAVATGFAALFVALAPLERGSSRSV